MPTDLTPRVPLGSAGGAGAQPLPWRRMGRSRGQPLPLFEERRATQDGPQATQQPGTRNRTERDQADIQVFLAPESSSSGPSSDLASTFPADRSIFARVPSPLDVSRRFVCAAWCMSATKSYARALRGGRNGKRGSGVQGECIACRLRRNGTVQEVRHTSAERERCVSSRLVHTPRAAARPPARVPEFYVAIIVTCEQQSQRVMCLSAGGVVLLSHTSPCARRRCALLSRCLSAYRGCRATQALRGCVSVHPSPRACGENGL